MTAVDVTVVIDAPPDAVWRVVERIEDHVQWMRDADAIRFEPGPQRGVGTRFVCDTRLGPLRVADHMEVVEWEPGRAMGVRHHGVVAGTGRFTLLPVGTAATRFAWHEHLRFPPWLGGPVGAFTARPVLAWVWGANLRALKQLVESGAR